MAWIFDRVGVLGLLLGEQMMLSDAMFYVHVAETTILTASDGECGGKVHHCMLLHQIDDLVTKNHDEILQSDINSTLLLCFAA